MAVSRYYSSSALETTLAAPISSSATTIVVASVSGFPIQYPYTLSIDADNGSKELVEVSAAVGTSLTVTRGVDTTANVSHALGAKVSHDHSARDFRESREHEIATAAHGATGAVVGTTNTQALTNKDLTSGTNTFPSSLATDAELTSGLAGKANTSHTHAEADVTGLVADLAAKAPVSTTVTLTGSQALTNKDLSSGTNTLPTAVATLTGSQTLTNKTLTAPVINGGSVVGASITQPTIVLAGSGGIATTVGGFLLGFAGDGDWPLLRSKVNTERHHARRGKLVAQNTSSAGTSSLIAFDEPIEADVGLTANGAETVFTIGDTGRYRIAGTATFAPNTGTGVFTGELLVNGSVIAYDRTPKRSASNDGIVVKCEETLALTAGDTVSMQVSQSTGTTIALVVSVNYFNRLSIEETTV